MSNNNLKKLVVVELIVIIFSATISLFISNKIDEMYKQEIINNYAIVVNNIIQNHPELEVEIISTIINENPSKDIISKYALDDVESINILEKNQKLKNQTIKHILLIVLIPLIISIIAFYIYYKIVYIKIKKLSSYTDNILNDDYSIDIRSYEEGELSNLKNDLYKMTVKLKKQTELLLKEKEYLSDILSDISHQLKTPLTSMYVINEVLSNEKIDQKTKKEFLLKERKQLERIEWLITSLLKMSRLDSDSEVLSRKKVKLNKLIEKVLEPLKIPIELKEIDLVLDYNNEIELNIDINWTAEALINILKNAYEHTENGTITITAKDNSVYTTIIITDTGEGISDKDLPHIFERFYKGSNNKESIGIGLNIAKKIINKQNGNIFVTTSKEGTSFIIKLYKYNM